VVRAYGMIATLPVAVVISVVVTLVMVLPISPRREPSSTESGP
jgi:energy-converting hydrogenase Eha subunit A